MRRLFLFKGHSERTKSVWNDYEDLLIELLQTDRDRPTNRRQANEVESAHFWEQIGRTRVVCR